MAIGVSSAAINLGVKPLARRRRLLLGATGVHCPGDVVIGSVAGSGTAAMVAAVADRAARSRAVSDRAR